MEGHESAGAVDNNYMTMDAEQWADHNDIYENRDALDIEFGRKKNLRRQQPGQDLEEKKERAKKGRDAANRAINTLPLPDRYITIRRPEPNATRGAGRRDQLVFFRCTTVGLVVLCLLLIGALATLSFVYASLAGIKVDINQKVDSLHEDNRQLKKDIEAMLNNISGSAYNISSSTYPDCLSEKDLLLVNPFVLEEYIKESSFFLNYCGMADDSSYNQYYWYCTCYST